MSFTSLVRPLLGLALCSLVLSSTLASAQTASPRVQVATNMGDFTLELNAERAPKSVANFLKYVESGHYAGTIFHRVIKDFMIQGGGFTADMSQKSVQAPIQNEASNGLKNVRGSIAMARTGDPHSATAQFFINTVDNSFLDYPGQDGWGYAVFGKVVAGMDVIDKIRGVPVANAGMHQNVPVKPVTIQSMKLLPVPVAK